MDPSPLTLSPPSQRPRRMREPSKRAASQLPAAAQLLAASPAAKARKKAKTKAKAVKPVKAPKKLKLRKQQQQSEAVRSEGSRAASLASELEPVEPDRFDKAAAALAVRAAATAAAADDEELGSSPMGVDEVADGLRQLDKLEYTAVWKVMLGGKERGIRTRILNGNDEVDTGHTTGGYAVLKKWSFSKADPLTWSLQRITCVASYKEKPSARYTNDIDDYDDYSRLVGHLMEWQGEGFTGLTVNLTACFEKIEQAIPSSSSAATPRLTATVRQQAIVEDQLASPAAISTGRDKSVALRNRWSCTQQSCPNYGGACYWTAVNSPEQHVPLGKDELEAWVKEIVAGRETVASPGVVIFNMLRLAKERMLSKSHSHGRASLRTNQQQQLPFNFYQVFDRDGGNTPFLPMAPTLSPTPAAANPPVYEQIDSSPTAPMELLDEFFDWCELRVDWRGEWRKLTEIKTAVEGQGYEVRDLLSMSEERWLKMDLGLGYLGRLQRCCSKFIDVRRRSPPARIQSTRSSPFDMGIS